MVCAFVSKIKVWKGNWFLTSSQPWLGEDHKIRVGRTKIYFHTMHTTCAHTHTHFLHQLEDKQIIISFLSLFVCCLFVTLKRGLLCKFDQALYCLIKNNKHSFQLFVCFDLIIFSSFSSSIPEPSPCRHLAWWYWWICSSAGSNNIY